MANRCAGFDPAWSHLAAPAPAPWPHAAWFSPTASAFENDVLASALCASMSPAPCAGYGVSSPTPSCSTTTSSSGSELSCIPPHDASAPPSAGPPGPASRAQKRTCTGKVAKRKTRPSRRPPTTYISADPANFRRMVQEITGLPGAEHAFSPAESLAASSRPAAFEFVLPTLDTSAFLADRAPGPAQRRADMASGRAATAMTAAAEPGADDSSLQFMRELEAIVSGPPVEPAFPTLESWGII